MRNIFLGAIVLCLSILTPLGGAKSAQAQIRLPDLQASTVYSRTYLGCIIDSRHYLSLRNTTSGTIRVGTPVYWSGKQEGQQPREYSAPLYANVSPGGVYQIGGAYKYDPSVQCRVWILRPRVATRAP